MKKMFAFLLAMVMLFSCVSAASAAESSTTEEAIGAETVLILTEEGNIAPQSTADVLYSGKRDYMAGGTWAWRDQVPKGYALSFGVQPTTQAAVVEIYRTTAGGIKIGSPIATATVQEGEYWSYMINSTVSGYYGVHIRPAAGSACTVAVVVLLGTTP